MNHYIIQLIIIFNNYHIAVNFGPPSGHHISTVNINAVNETEQSLTVTYLILTETQNRLTFSVPGRIDSLDSIQLLKNQWYSYVNKLLYKKQE